MQWLLLHLHLNIKKIAWLSKNVIVLRINEENNIIMNLKFLGIGSDSLYNNCAYVKEVDKPFLIDCGEGWYN